MSRIVLAQAAACGILAALLAGCSPPGTGQVSGKVVYKGSPVTDAVLNLIMKEKGIAVMAPIDAAGSFTVTDPLDVGTYTAYVTATPPVAGPPGSKVVRPTAPRVPRKAGDATTSDTLVAVKGGKNELTIEFKD